MLKKLLKSLLLSHLHHNKPPRRPTHFLLRLSQTITGTQAAPEPKVTPKQDELNKHISIENEILVSLYWKRDLGQASESDHKEILTRQATLKQLKEELKEVIQNATWHKMLPDKRKHKLESMDEVKSWWVKPRLIWVARWSAISQN